LAGKYYEILNINTTDGMYINLNDGKIGANNFSLEAGTGDPEQNQLILSSSPPRFYMQLGKTDKASKISLIDINPD
jgi:hypothetical protein